MFVRWAPYVPLRYPWVRDLYLSWYMISLHLASIKFCSRCYTFIFLRRKVECRRPQTRHWSHIPPMDVVETREVGTFEPSRLCLVSLNISFTMCPQHTPAMMGYTGLSLGPRAQGRLADGVSYNVALRQRTLSSQTERHAPRYTRHPPQDPRNRFQLRVNPFDKSDVFSHSLCYVCGCRYLSVLAVAQVLPTTKNIIAAPPQRGRSAESRSVTACVERTGTTTPDL